jgi:hypothetical protein
VRYDNDRDVGRYGTDGYTVHRDGTNYRVLPNDAMGWGVFTGDRLDMVGNGWASAEGAIDWIRSGAR